MNFSRKPKGLESLLARSIDLQDMWKHDFKKIESSQYLYDFRNKMIEFVLTECERFYEKTNRTGNLTVGIEVEFFVREIDGNLITLERSQQLFKQLQTISPWQTHGIGKSDFIEWVSKESHNKKYTKIKYEYAPHMLEISTTYFDNLHDLRDELDQTINDLRKAVTKLDMVLEYAPVLDPLAEVENREETKLAALDHSRRVYLKDITGKSFNEIANFPAYVASAQIHVGGIKWWRQENLLNMLYKIESKGFLYGSTLSCSNFSTALNLYNYRLSLYEACFPGFALVGIPPFPSWNLRNWVSAMLSSPLIGTGESNFSGKKFIDIKTVENSHDIFRSFRDFQLVRPRIYSTIEFRGCPSRLDLDYLISVAAFRLGIMAFLQDSGDPTHLDLLESRIEWKKNLHNLQDIKQQLATIIDLSKASLAKRGLKEEIYILDPDRKDHIPNGIPLLTEP